MKTRSLVAAVLISPALIIVGIRLAPDAGPQAAPAPTATSTPVAPHTSDTPTPSPTPSLSAAGVRARETAARFTRSWLDTNPGTRARGLKTTATAELAGQLAATDARRIPHARLVGAPEVTLSQSDTAAAARAVLSNQQGLTLDLVADPQAATGWRVTDVLPD
jgi:hypothetical protein